MSDNLIYMNISYKSCTKCKKTLELWYFDKNKGMKDGHFNQCKSCRNKSRKPRTNRSEENRTYFQANKDRIKSKRKQRYATDLDFRVSCNLRNRLGKIIRGKSKSGSAIKDLGCSVLELKRYLESKFKPGMSWDNYGFGKGRWNIDHVIPISAFDLSKRDEFLKACHFSNLQPLWHEENIKKSDIYDL